MSHLEAFKFGWWEAPLRELEAFLESASMDRLVEEANRAHSNVITNGRRTVVEIYRAGRILEAEQMRLEHGDWLRWLKAKHPNISQRTAWNYMQVAKIPKLEIIANFKETYQNRVDPNITAVYRQFGIIKQEKKSKPAPPRTDSAVAVEAQPEEAGPEREPDQVLAAKPESQIEPEWVPKRARFMFEQGRPDASLSALGNAVRKAADELGWIVREADTA